MPSQPAMDLEDTTKKLTQELTLIRTEYDQLFAKFERSQDLFEERDALMKRQVDSLTEQNAHLSNHLFELKNGIKTQFMHNLSFDEDVQNLEKLAHSQEEQIVKQEEQITKLTSENARYLRDLNIKSDDMDNLRDELGRIKQKIHNDMVTRSEYDIEVSKFRNLQNHIDDNMVTLVLFQQLQGKYDLLLAEKDSLEKSLLAQKESNTVLSERLGELNSLIAKLEQTNNALTIQIGLLKQQSRRDGDEVKKIRNEMTSNTKIHEHECLKYQLEVSHLTASNKELTSRSTSLESHLLDTIKKLEIENKSLVDLHAHYKSSAVHWADKARNFENQLVSIQHAVLSPELSGSNAFEHDDSSRSHRLFQMYGQSSDYQAKSSSDSNNNNNNNNNNYNNNDNINNKNIQSPDRTSITDYNKDLGTKTTNLTSLDDS